MYSFALMEFPSFMQTLRRFQRVNRVHSRDGVMVYEAALERPGLPPVLEYSSARSHVSFVVLSTGMRVRAVKDGSVVVDSEFTDFLAVKDAIRVLP